MSVYAARVECGSVERPDRHCGGDLVTKRLPGKKTLHRVPLFTHYPCEFQTCLLLRQTSHNRDDQVMCHKRQQHKRSSISQRCAQQVGNFSLCMTSVFTQSPREDRFTVSNTHQPFSEGQGARTPTSSDVTNPCPAQQSHTLLQ